MASTLTWISLWVVDNCSALSLQRDKQILAKIMLFKLHFRGRMMEDGFTEAEVHHASSDNMIVPEHQTVINPV